MRGESRYWPTKMLPKLRQGPAPRGLLSRAVGQVYGVVSRGLARVGAAMSSASWESTDHSNPTMRRFRPGCGSATADINASLPQLRAQARDLERKNPIAAGVMNTKVGAVVSTGLTPNAAPMREVLGLSDDAAEKLGRQMEWMWALHSSSSDFSVDRAATAGELLELAYHSCLSSGDPLIVRRSIQRKSSTFATCWQVIEADRISNPNGQPDSDTLSGGVELGPNGERLGFWVQDRHPGDTAPGAPHWGYISARDQEDRPAAFLLGHRTRPGQVRCTPDLAVVAGSLKQYTTLRASELESAVAQSAFAAAVKTLSGEGPPVGNTSRECSTVEAQYEDGESIPSGSMFRLGLGEDITMVESKRPSPLLDPYLMSCYRELGAALNIPVEVLIKHFQSSYSAARAALADFWEWVLRERTWLVRNVMKFWYAETQSEAAARGLIGLPGFFSDPMTQAAYLNATWTGTAQPQLDPLKEVNAAILLEEHGYSTGAAETQKLNGGDWDRNQERKAMEKRKRTSLGLSAPPPSASVVPPPPDPDAADAVADPLEPGAQPERATGAAPRPGIEAEGSTSG